MKFAQLEIGQRFRYRNADYTKTGPLQAVEDGANSAQLIMRSADVQIPAPQHESDPPLLSERDRLRRAIDLYHGECKAILRATAADPGDALGRLEMRYQALLQALEKK